MEPAKEGEEEQTERQEENPGTAVSWTQEEKARRGNVTVPNAADGPDSQD